VKDEASILWLEPPETDELERLLAENLTGVASDLRLVDAADFVAFIRMGQTANLRNIVQSSTELHFKPGTLRLAPPAEAVLRWSGPPIITLPMQFRRRSVLAYFRLRLAAESASVTLESVTAEFPDFEFQKLRREFAAALGEARIPAQPSWKALPADLPCQRQ
jgi:hypothetical protein